MKEFIEYIVKNLVDKPDEVQVNEIHGERIPYRIFTLLNRFVYIIMFK